MTWRALQSGFRYSKAGIVAQGVIPATDRQPALFETMEHNRAYKVITAVDEANSLGSRDRRDGGCRLCGQVRFHDEFRGAVAKMYVVLGRTAEMQVLDEAQMIWKGV